MNFLKLRFKLIIDEKIKILKFFRRRKLSNKNFTIISNNCWAGNVYRYFGIPYRTPTIGVYFWAKDYIKFSSNLKFYLDLELKFISYKESRYKSELIAKNQTHVPIGILGDIEIVFLHYTDAKKAKRKWDRRVSRVNYNNLLFKFSEMNICTSKELEAFDRITIKNKIMFVKNNTNLYKSGIYFPGYENKYNIANDTDLWNSQINIYHLLDNMQT